MIITQKAQCIINPPNVDYRSIGLVVYRQLHCNSIAQLLEEIELHRNYMRRKYVYRMFYVCNCDLLIIKE